MQSPAPDRQFASDNLAGVHPLILEAVERANSGHALPYGLDDHTHLLERSMSELFDHDVIVRPVFGGTGANVLALSCLARPGGAVACSAVAHIAVDEAGAPEHIVGTKLIGLPHANGKISPADVRSLDATRNSQHHAPACTLSITQATEYGSVYSPTEVVALVEAARELDMRVHMDGARIANAVAAIGGGRDALRSVTSRAGIDALSFGGTKNGLLFGEVVVFFDRSLAEYSLNLRKQVTQLPSKMRFVSAQYLALLEDDLWLDLAGHANAMARDLHSRLVDIGSLRIDQPPAVNSLFPTLKPEVKRDLQAWSFFWDWDVSANLVRWMTAWDTTPEDVQMFAAGVRERLAR
jgi:threonine aldolase